MLIIFTECCYSDQRTQIFPFSRKAMTSSHFTVKSFLLQFGALKQLSHGCFQREWKQKAFATWQRHLFATSNLGNWESLPWRGRDSRYYLFLFICCSFLYVQFKLKFAFLEWELRRKALYFKITCTETCSNYSKSNLGVNHWWKSFNLWRIIQIRSQRSLLWTPAQSPKARPSCSGLCLVGSWKPPVTAGAEPFRETCFAAWLQGEGSPCSLIEALLLPFCCLFSHFTMYHCEGFSPISLVAPSKPSGTIRWPQSCLFSRLTQPSSPTAPHRVDAPDPNSLWLCSKPVLGCPVLGAPKQDMVSKHVLMSAE